MKKKEILKFFLKLTDAFNGYVGTNLRAELLRLKNDRNAKAINVELSKEERIKAVVEIAFADWKLSWLDYKSTPHLKTYFAAWLHQAVIVDSVVLGKDPIATEICEELKAEFPAPVKQILRFKDSRYAPWKVRGR